MKESTHAECRRGCAAVQSDDRNDSYHSIASELASLIAHARAGIELIDSAIAREQVPGNQELAANVVVLDDVAPGCVKADAALPNNDAPACPLLSSFDSSKFSVSPSAFGRGVSGRAGLALPRGSVINSNRHAITDDDRPACPALLFQPGGMYSGAHQRVLLGRGARPLLLVLSLQKRDIDLGTVDADKFAPPIGQAGRR